MLALGIRYLTGFVAASEPDSRERAEWPPHPGRVFMALAAAHFQSDADPNEREALCWLEKQAPPAIRAGEHSERALVTHYVPVNDKAGPSKALLQSAPLTRDRQPRTFARAYLEDDTVYLLWPSASPSPSLCDSLAKLCGKVSRIGHSSSLVQMWLATEEEAHAPTWLPDDERAVVQLRVPGPGTLGTLERHYNGAAVEDFAALQLAAFDDTDKKAQKAARNRLRNEYPDGAPTQLKPRLAMYQGYARTSTETETATRGTVFSPHFTVLTLEREDGPHRQLDLACVLPLMQRWREAILSYSNDLPSHIRALLSGHDADGAPLGQPHLALLPLAFVDHPHADGHLLGVAVSLPTDLSPEDRRTALRAVARVQQLKIGRLGLWRLASYTALSPAHNLRADTWTAHTKARDGQAGATEWSTVTPIAFDRHAKAKDPAGYRREVAAMISDACVRIGLPKPREVIVTPVSAHLGVPPSHAFPRLRRKDGGERRHTHAILLFDEPVCGPVLLGAGRYRGYGMCRPLGGESTGSKTERGRGADA